MQVRPYQQEGVDFLAARTVALLAWQMRLGKTIAAVLASDKIAAKRILVLCPAIATRQWVAEWAQWSPDRAPAVRIEKGTPPPEAEGVHVESLNRVLFALDCVI